MNQSPSKQQLNVYLPPKLIIQVKHASIDQGVSISAFVEQALQQYLEQLSQQENHESHSE